MTDAIAVLQLYRSQVAAPHPCPSCESRNNPMSMWKAPSSSHSRLRRHWIGDCGAWTLDCMSGLIVIDSVEAWGWQLWWRHQPPTCYSGWGPLATGPRLEAALRTPEVGLLWPPHLRHTATRCARAGNEISRNIYSFHTYESIILWANILILMDPPCLNIHFQHGILADS